MIKKTKVILIIIALILLLLPFAIYFFHFREFSLSDDTETWGQFGDYLNGTFMPLIALIGVIVTLLFGLISERRNKANLKIEQEKYRPMLHIGYYDSENEITIFQKNKGNGPLLITKYRIVSLVSPVSYESFFDCIPSISEPYDNYTGNQDNTVLSPNEEMELLRFCTNNKQYSSKNADQIRKIISKYKIVVEYKDIFNNNMPTYERSLKWFGRKKY